MKILIDTHVMVWLLYDSPRLGRTARKLLADSANQVFVSYVSPLEIAIKAATGKMTYTDKVFDVLDEAGMTLLYPNREMLRAYRIYNSANKDPFDNMLLSAAQTEKCAFMTSDAKILTSRPTGVKLLDARL